MYLIKYFFQASDTFDFRIFVLSASKAAWFKYVASQ